LSAPNFYKSNVVLVEVDCFILLSFRVLIIGSLFSGFLLKDVFSGLGQSFFYSLFSNTKLISVTSFVSINYLPLSLIESDFLPFYIKLIPIIFSLIGLFLALFCYTYKALYIIIVKFQITNLILQRIFFFFLQKGLFEGLYNRLIAVNIYKFG
jgi:hypothetical protein